MSTARGRRLSVASRLASAVIVVGAVTICVASVVGLRLGDRAVHDIVDRRLEAIRIAEQYELSAYLAGVRANVSGIASSPMTAEAVTAFSDSYPSLRLPSGPQLATARAELLEHYRNAIVPPLEAATGRPQDPRRLLPESSAGIHLQHLFLVGSDGADVAASLPAQATEDDAIEWLRWYATFDPVYRDIADRLGADELSLIDRAGNVVYAARSSPDVATNLFVGPHSGQTLAVAVRRAVGGWTTETELTDLVMYNPAGGRPVWFAVAPVLSEGRVVGAIALRWTVDPINRVFAAHADGREGVGDTGEVYAAGTDHRLRADPRQFRESPAQYLAAALEAGTLTPEQVALIEARGTTVLVHRADGDVVATAAAGESDLLHRSDHLGREAIMSVGPLGVSGMDWVVVSQVVEAEPGAAQEDYRRLLIFAATVLIALLTFGAVTWAQRVVLPLRLVSERIAARPDPPAGTLEPAAGPIESRCDEFARLIDGFASMRATLRERRDAVERAYAHRREVLEGLLPDSVAGRVDVGDRSFVDRVPSVSVVVVVLHEPDGGQRPTIRRGVDEIVTLIDEVAHRHGVERVKLVGDTYFAAVGHQRPYLDHTRRAASFAQDLADTLDGSVTSLGVSVAMGVAGGPVTVGLAGSTQLVYDVWGSTVNEAYRLARSAPIGSTLLTDASHERLPDAMASRRVQLPGGDAWRLERSGAVDPAREVSS